MKKGENIMKKNYWISKEERVQIKNNISIFRRDKCFYEATYLESVLSYLDGVQNMIQIFNSFEEYYISEKDYRELENLYVCYRNLIRSLVQYESNLKIEECYDILKKCVYEFEVQDCLPISNPHVPHRVLCSIYPEIANCTSLKDVLFVAISTPLTYPQYEELAEAYVCTHFGKKQNLKLVDSSSNNTVTLLQDKKMLMFLKKKNKNLETKKQLNLFNNESVSEIPLGFLPNNESITVKQLDYLPIIKR